MPHANPLSSIAEVLSALRALPFWVLLGLALAGWTILFASSGVESALFRQQWGPYVWAEAVIFSFLTATFCIQEIIISYLSYNKTRAQKKILHFVPVLQTSWWHLAKQRDDSYCSQLSLDIQASNMTDFPVRIIKVNLDRPKASVLQASAMLPAVGSPYHSNEHAVPPRGTIKTSVHIMAKGAFAARGKPIRINLSLIDQYGTVYKIKNIFLKTHDTPMRRRNFSQWLKDRRDNRKPKPSMPWNFQEADYLNLCNAILEEEKRSYAACGRRGGGLGSLNVTLQSEPNYGWTTQGQIPSLLWPQGEGKTISSPNMERLLKIHADLDSQNKINLECYLLTALQKEKQFSEIAYFIFLALHRMGRTIDALRTARTFLKGDKVYGYSNLLGTLSAVVSHEHTNIDSQLFQLLLDEISNDDEPDFRLKQKINLARLEHLDRAQAGRSNG